MDGDLKRCANGEVVHPGEVKMKMSKLGPLALVRAGLVGESWSGLGRDSTIRTWLRGQLHTHHATVFLHRGDFKAAFVSRQCLHQKFFVHARCHVSYQTSEIP